MSDAKSKRSEALREAKGKDARFLKTNKRRSKLNKIFLNKKL